MSVPQFQVTFFLDTDGKLHAESKGRNGQRQKFDLEDAEEFLLTIGGELAAEAFRAQQIRAQTIAAPTSVSAKSISQIAKDQDQEYLNGLTDKERETTLARRTTEAEKRRQQELDRARDLWLETARNHTVELANRVIDDPARRPRRHVLINNIAVSPRTYDPMNPVITAEQKAAIRARKNGAIEVDL